MQVSSMRVMVVKDGQYALVGYHASSLLGLGLSCSFSTTGLGYRYPPLLGLGYLSPLLLGLGYLSPPLLGMGYPVPLPRVLPIARAGLATLARGSLGAPLVRGAPLSRGA